MIGCFDDWWLFGYPIDPPDMLKTPDRRPPQRVTVVVEAAWPVVPHIGHRCTSSSSSRSHHHHRSTRTTHRSSTIATLLFLSFQLLLPYQMITTTIRIRSIVWWWLPPPSILPTTSWSSGGGGVVTTAFSSIPLNPTHRIRSPPPPRRRRQLISHHRYDVNTPRYNILQERSFMTIAATSSSSSSSATSLFSTTIPADVTPLLLPHLEFSSSTNTNANDDNDERPVVLLLHGLLGNKRNFASIGRSLVSSCSSSHTVPTTNTTPIIYSLDLRNHGDSYYNHSSTSTRMKQIPPHHELDQSHADTTLPPASSSWIDMSYRTMAYDVIHFCNVHHIQQIDTLIGHSIGGKVAQYVSLFLLLLPFAIRLFRFYLTIFIYINKKCSDSPTGPWRYWNQPVSRA